jgi:glycosyltransferase involved in cell wall biosynthesis
VVKAAAFAVPGDLSTPTGGYAYDRRMIAELIALGWQIDVLDLGEGFPRPDCAVRAAACAKLAAVGSDRPIVVDGLAFGVLPEAVRMLRESHPLLALVHHPLALESGLSAVECTALRRSEQAALVHARRVIVTSATTARLLCSDYRVPPERLSVVVPGTDRIDVDRRPRTRDGMVALLAVGAVVPRKGYDVLIAALARLVHLPWRLTIVGDRERSPSTLRFLEDEINRLALADRIALHGAVTAAELGRLYAASDLFVLPSRFEGYGMAYAAAIAHGLPVLGTTAGAIPETVPSAAAMLVTPDDVEALAGALRALIEDTGLRGRLADGARAAEFPSWQEQARLFARALEHLA